MIRGDKIRLGDKWLYWNSEQILMCNNERGSETLKELYGDLSSQIDILYPSLLIKANAKN